MSWIALDDDVDRDPSTSSRPRRSSGPVNLTAPNPVTQRGVHRDARARAAPADGDADAAVRAEGRVRRRARRDAARESARVVARSCKRADSSSRTPSSTARSTRDLTAATDGRAALDRHRHRRQPRRRGRAACVPRAHPDVDLVGVSTTGGRTEWRAELARRARRRRRRGRGAARTSWLAGLPRRSPDAVLAIGPLTNVAALLALGVRAPAAHGHGRRARAGPAPGPAAAVEHNFVADPAAAAVVVAAWTTRPIVPLDVTVAMRLEPTRRSTELVARARRSCSPRSNAWIAEHDDPVVLHDPLALLVARRRAARHDRVARARRSTRRDGTVASTEKKAASTRSS